MAKNRKVSEAIEGFEKQLSSNKALEKFLPTAFAFFCCIDGNVDPSEIEKAGKLGKKFLGKKFKITEFKKAVEDVSTMLSIATPEIFLKWENLISTTLGKMEIQSEREKELIVALFCEVAFADGKVDEAEARLIDKISDAMGVTNKFDITPDSSAKENKLQSSDELTGTLNAFGLVAKLMTDTLVQSGDVPANRKYDCISIASNIVFKDMKSAADLMSNDKNVQVVAFVKLRTAILEEMGLAEHKPPKQRYSSTVTADTHEELMSKKRAVGIYASLGLASILGFLGCFGYGIYLFFTDTGNPLIFFVLGVILYLFQKWAGKKHDAITD